jgi:hypothetical protein
MLHLLNENGRGYGYENGDGYGDGYGDGDGYGESPKPYTIEDGGDLLIKLAATNQLRRTK